MQFTSRSGEREQIALSRKRSRLELYEELLGLCVKPKTRTQLLGRTGLSWGILNKYLDQMQSLALLEVHYSRPRYATTPKGRRLLMSLQKLSSLLKTPSENSINVP